MRRVAIGLLVILCAALLAWYLRPTPGAGALGESPAVPEVTAHADATPRDVPALVVGPGVEPAPTRPSGAGAGGSRAPSAERVAEARRLPSELRAGSSAARPGVRGTLRLLLTVDGAPAADLAVDVDDGVLRDEGPQERRGESRRSDAEGWLTLADLESGRHGLWLRPLGFEARWLEIEVPAGASVEQTVALARGLSVSGAVFAPPGRSLAEIRVFTHGPSGGITGVIEPRSTTEGTYRLGGLLPGRYRVHASLQGFPDACGEVEVAADRPVPGPELRPGQGATIRGRLVRPDGTPIAGARPELRPVDGWDLVGSAECDTDGRFVLVGVSPGAYRLVLRRSSGEEQPRRDLTVGADDVDVGDLVDEAPPVTLDVHVRAPDGSQPEGAEVFAEDAHGASMTSTTEAGGRAEVGYLRAGRVRVWARSGGQVGQSEVEARPGLPTPVEIVLAAGLAIEGAVTLPEGEAGPAKLTVWPRGRPFASLFPPKVLWREVEARPDGRYRVEGLPPGDYFVSVDGATGAREVAGGSGETLRIDFPLADWTAVLDVAVSGLPEGTWARATVEWTDGPAVPAGQRDTVVRDGWARFRRIRPGPVACWASIIGASGTTAYRQAGAAGPGAAPIAIDVRSLAGTGAIAGRIDGPAPERILIMARGPACAATTFPGTDGAFRLAGLPAGAYELGVCFPDGQWNGPPRTVSVGTGALDAGLLSRPVGRW